MTAKSKAEIQAFFETGDKPTQAQFADLIDSYIDKTGPLGTIETLASGNSIGVPAFAGGVGSIKSYSELRADIAVSALYASTAVGVAGADTDTIMTPSVTKNAIMAIALTTANFSSTAQGNAGTDNTTIMTPVLVKNAVAALGSVPVGGVVNTITYTYTTNGPTGTTAMPIDDTIPQITEGNQVFNQSYTMSSTTNKLRVNFKGALAGSVQVHGVALFVNGASNAVAAVAVGPPNNSSFPGMVDLTYEFVPGTVAAQLYEIRMGNAAGTAARFNGTITARLFGGTEAATLTFTEIKA